MISAGVARGALRRAEGGGGRMAGSMAERMYPPHVYLNKTLQAGSFCARCDEQACEGEKEARGRGTRLRVKGEGRERGDA